MGTSLSQSIRRIAAVVMLLFAISAIGAWFWTRDTLPSVIRVAAAEPGGLYFGVASELEKPLERRTRHLVRVIETAGSAENHELLVSGEVDIAILQGGTTDTEKFAVIAPLYPEVVHILIRPDRGMMQVRDLVGRRVALGKPGSGMRQSALQILEHYRITLSDIDETEHHFTDLMTDDTLDAAIVTTGTENPDLRRLLDSGRFALMPILDARALELKHAHFRYFEIPRGLYDEGPPVPDVPIPTVASTAYLVCKPDASNRLVHATLAALYDDGVASRFPTFIPKRDARTWGTVRWHPVAGSYLDPFDQLGYTANIMESLVATKELLVAAGALLFLLWSRWRRLRENEEETHVAALKERLDTFLERTVQLERTQMKSNDPARLQEYLQEVTRIKLQAIEELTHEDLRGDRMFSIFLAQCADLSHQIQNRLSQMKPPA